jgi:hypothetical protein
MTEVDTVDDDFFEAQGLSPDAPTYEAAALDAEDDGDAAYNRRFQELAAKLRMLFDDARYPWLSEQSVVCVSHSAVHLA